VTVPDSDRTDAPECPGADARNRVHRRQIAPALLLLLLGAVLYLALMPNLGRPRFTLVSPAVYRWFAEHDDFNNIAAFGGLAMVAFLVGCPSPGGKKAGALNAFACTFASRTSRLAGMLAMVCLLEALQNWIPGRVSELQDVCTGWSGIFAAWLLCALLDARGRSCRPAARRTGGL
jgi:hypothetical protein